MMQPIRGFHLVAWTVLATSLLAPLAAQDDKGPRGKAGRLSAILEQIADAHDRGGHDGAAGKARELGLAVRGLGEKAEVIVLLEAAGNAPDPATVARLGGTVLAASKSFLRASVKPAALRRLAGHPGVVVRTPTVAKANSGLGSVVSESVERTGADALQASGLSGAGVKVAVVDLGFIGLTDAINAGELPAGLVRVTLPGQIALFLETGTEHGTGVSEHVMDMAPGAQLYCIKVDDELDLENAAAYCRDNGIRIANHSVGWVNSSYYDNTGPINRIFNDSYANGAGVFWTVAAGNDANRHWRGSWSDVDGDRFLNFGGGADELLATGSYSTASIFLNWNQYGNSVTDLDLYVYNNLNQRVASSVGWQTGTQDPAEAVSFAYNPAEAPYQVRVYWYAGSTANLDITLFSFYHNFDRAVPSSSFMDPSNASGAFCVGAIDMRTYDVNPVIESYSSQGPTNDGRQKPDLAAPDGTSSMTYQSGGSFGTSFSSPTTAGAAALLLEQDPRRSAADLAALLRSSTADLGSAGWDPVYGAGKLELSTAPPPPPVNQPPTADAQTVVTTVGTPVSITLTGSDPEGSALTFVIVSQPILGSLSALNGATCVYTPGEAGTDTFSFKVNDGQLDSVDAATVTVTIQPGKSIHIASVTMSKQRVGFFTNKWQARAIVKIVDQNNQAVSGVSVAGVWYGAVSVSQAAYTGATGEATFTSPSKGGGGTFGFLVTGVWKADTVYDSASNVVSGGTITAP